MEILVLLLIAAVVLVLVGAIAGIVAYRQGTALRQRVDELEREVLRLARREAPAHDASARTQTSMSPHEPAAPWPEPQAVREPEPQRAPEPTPATAAEIAAALAAEPRQAMPEPATPPEPQPAAAAATPPEPARPQPEPGAAAMPPPLPARQPAPGMPIAAPATRVDDEHFGSVEKALGMRWLTWIGVGLLFLGIAFFLKYAYDRDWLGRYFGPRLRIATATTVALMLAFTGWRSLKNGMTALGQGLLGGGQALLYLTVFSAYQPAVMVVDTPLLGATTAFVSMIAVTALGLAAAVRLDAIAMAFLAVLGGFATPVLIQTGQDSRDALCAYLLLLDLGVLAVAAWRQWRALDVLAFAGTAVLFGGWWAAWHHAHPQPDATLLWLGVFHVVFLVLPFVQHWRQRTPATAERFVLALANVAWSLAYAATLLRETAPRLLAGGCFGAAVLYAALGVVTARRVGGDIRTRDGFFALAALVATVGLFFLLPTNAITTAWFGEAAVLVWVGYRFAHRTSRRFALLVLGAAMTRTVFVHLPDASLAAPLLWNQWCVTLLVAGIGLAAFAALHARHASEAAERTLARGAGVLAGLWTLGALSAEILRHANGTPTAWSANGPALTIAWLQSTGALGFLLWTRWRPSTATFAAATVPLLAAGIAIIRAYERYPADAWAVLNGACLAGLAIVALLGLAARIARQQHGPAGPRESLLGAAQLALTALATVETAAFLQRGDHVPGRTTVAQTLVWVWLGLTAAGAGAATTWASRRVLALASLPLAAAALGALWLYGQQLDPHLLIANQRFGAGMLAAAATAALHRPLRQLVSDNAAHQASAMALMGALVFGCCEAVTWANDNCEGRAVGRWSVWLLGATFVLGSAGAAWRAPATDNKSLRAVGLFALAPALLLPLAAYATPWEPRLMFVNPRLMLVAASVATVWMWSRPHRSTGLRRLALIVGLIGLTLEPPTWFLDHVEESAEAARLARFSITVTWIVAAIALLVVGFRRDLRMPRLTALTLFVLTAAKVLIVDMSGAQQLYRILAFLLVGVVFVGASWAYHRAERRLAAARAATATRQDADDTA
ncbi:MAG: DUF2339 domain-containing protein [Planctomycetota bacterium]